MTTQDTPSGHRTPLLLGGIIALLVGICVLTAWPQDSTVATWPAADVAGPLLWIRIFGVVQATAFVVFLVALFAIRRHPSRTGVVLAIAAVIQFLPLAGPMILSADGWSYWSVGRIATVLDGNPFVNVAAQYPLDVSHDYVFDAWREQITPYGPLWVVSSAVVALTSGADANAATLLFRVAAGASMVALAFIVSRSSPRPAFAAVFVGWNPIFAMQFAGSGHNDSIVATLVVGGLLLAGYGRARLGGLLWATAVFVKWLPLVLVPLQLAGEYARKRRSIIPSMMASLIALSIAATWVFGTSWAGAINPVAENASAGIRSLAVWPRLGGPLPDVLMRFGPLALFVPLYLVLLSQAWRGRTRCGLAAALFLLFSPLLWPWYLITPAALSAHEDDAAAMALVVILCVYAGLFYLGDGGSVLDVYLAN